MIKKFFYKENCPVKMEILELKNYPWHMHTDIHICYVLSGEIDLKLTYTHYRLKENHIHFIHSEDIHGFKSITEKSTVLLLTFDMDHFSKLFPNLGNQMFSTRSLNYEDFYTNQTMLRKQIFSLVLQAYKYKESSQYRQMIINSAVDIFKTLYRDFRNFKIGDDKLWKYHVTHDTFQIDRISRIISYIYANYNCNVNLKSIADNENINIYYLSHLFQKFIGINFRDFLNMTRVETSEYELLATDKAISKIALDVGFSNYNYFVNTFKKWFGMHPKDYRKTYFNETILQKKPACKIVPLIDFIPKIEKELSKLNVIDIPDIKKSSLILDLCPKADSLLFKNNPIHSDIAKYNIKNLINLNPLISYDIDPAKVYDHYYPHKYCMELLNSIVLKRSLNLPPLQIVDTVKNQNGIFAINGMKKPLYYLYIFLTQLFNNFIKTGTGHIVTCRNEEYSIILFNNSTFFDFEVTFNFTEMESKYKLTQKILSASNSCIDYWFQLDFKQIIDNDDFQFIEHMTFPETSFVIIPETKIYSYTINLRPLDIVHIKFSKQ